MLVYPIPHAVTQARVQLVADQTEKAPPHVIREDVLNVFAAKNDAERQALADFKEGHAKETQAKKAASDDLLTRDAQAKSVQAQDAQAKDAHAQPKQASKASPHEDHVDVKA